MCNWVSKTEFQSTDVSVLEGKAANSYHTICLYSENTLYTKEIKGKKGTFFVLFQRRFFFFLGGGSIVFIVGAKQ